MKNSLKVKQACLLVAIASTAATGYARSLPHVELVKKLLQGAQYKEVLKECKSIPLAAPIVGADKELECWAAATAKALDKQSPALSSLILNDSARENLISSCSKLAKDEQSENPACATARLANTFIALKSATAMSTPTP